MSQQLRKDAPLPHQADKRQGPGMACGALAVLPGMQDDVTRLTPATIIRISTEYEFEVHPKKIRLCYHD